MWVLTVKNEYPKLSEDIRQALLALATKCRGQSYHAKDLITRNNLVARVFTAPLEPGMCPLAIIDYGARFQTHSQKKTCQRVHRFANGGATSSTAIETFHPIEMTSSMGPKGLNETENDREISEEGGDNSGHEGNEGSGNSPDSEVLVFPSSLEIDDASTLDDSGMNAFLLTSSFLPFFIIYLFLFANNEERQRTAIAIVERLAQRQRRKSPTPGHPHSREDSIVGRQDLTISPAMPFDPTSIGGDLFADFTMRGTTLALEISSFMTTVLVIANKCRDLQCLLTNEQKARAKAEKDLANQQICLERLEQELEAERLSRARAEEELATTGVAKEELESKFHASVKEARKNGVREYKKSKKFGKYVASVSQLSLEKVAEQAIKNCL